MHWCSRHLFSACHSHNNKCKYICTCTPIRQCSISSGMKTFTNYPISWILNFCTFLYFWARARAAQSVRVFNQKALGRTICSANVSSWFNSKKLFCILGQTFFWIEAWWRISWTERSTQGFLAEYPDWLRSPRTLLPFNLLYSSLTASLRPA